MKHNNRLNELLTEFTVMSQNKSVPNLEKTEYLELVNFCISNKDLDKSLKVVDSAIQTFPASPEFAVKKIEILLLLNQPEQALEILATIEHINLLSLQARLLKAKALKATGKNQDALDILEGLDDDQKNSFEVYLLQASLLENLNQFENVYQLVKNQILMTDKTQLDPLLEKLFFFTEITSNFEDAVEFYDQVLDLHPFSDIAWKHQGIAYNTLGNCKAAIDAFEFSIAINPKSREAYFGCAECFEKADRFDLAINYYNEYLDAIQMDDADALVRLANCFYGMDELNSAELWLQKAIGINPDLPEAYLILGQIYGTSNPEKAIEYLNEAIDIDPFNENYVIALATLHAALDNIDTAANLYQQAVDTAPDVIETWFPYIRFLIKTKKEQLLQENIEELTAYFNKEKTIFFKIAGLFALEKRKEAEYWLAEALATYDESPEILFEISPNLVSDQEIQDIISRYKD